MWSPLCLSLIHICYSFKKTKSMSALLEERQKRRKEKSSNPDTVNLPAQTATSSQPNLKSLVESVKRKSAAATEHGGTGKRRKL